MIGFLLELPFRAYPLIILRAAAASVWVCILRGGASGLIGPAAAFAAAKGRHLADQIPGGQAVCNGIFATIRPQEQGRTVYAQQKGRPRILALFKPLSSS